MLGANTSQGGWGAQASIPESAQGQAGLGLERPGTVEGVPAHELLIQGPSNPNDSVIL